MDGSTLIDPADAAPLRDVSLDDRYDIGASAVLLSGVQAMIRLPLAQKARDAALGWRTAGYIAGYRGSPLGGVDLAAWKAAKALAASDVRFEPALNEDLAATMMWGAQQAHLRGRGAYEGVFGLWYGKGPGLDRSGDVFRHANLAGVGPKGGVLVAMGDDHTCESSTACHQTDVTLMDAHIPVLHPAGPQEILDFGLIGWGLSRFTGCWVGLKCLKDTVEATTVVDGRVDRVALVRPDAPTPPEGLNIILGETPHQQEARLIDWRLPAVAPFARANGLDRRGVGRPGARFGIVASGKSWLDLMAALDLLGIDAAEAERLGVATYKIGLAWPLDGDGLRDFARGLESLMVVEEKRAFIETQAKEALYALPDRPEIVGKRDRDGAPLFSAKLDLDPLEIAEAIGARLVASGEAPGVAAALERVRAMRREQSAPKIAERAPYFCSGCPHNSSTKVPTGSRAAAGIGCHYMVQWMDRETVGFTHMGGEGAQWIGESRFSTEEHIFQNIGDGTYNHSGLIAIRAAVAAGVNITYKLLYNDAVAMTGGQPNDGRLTPYRVAEELLAAGVTRLVAVVDPKEEIDRGAFPATVKVRDRAELDLVQRELREVEGVSVLLYVQTCAAEKRRRRKRGTFPELDKRVFINPLVCEGCGDCGQKSNCVSILPHETPFGRKRRIDQSSCNKDLSCLDGFCPSFVTVTGAQPKRAAEAFRAPDLPEPTPPRIGDASGRSAEKTWNLLVTGVGGTGVVTVGALLGMAAHLEGKGAGVMEMAGLAQKGGAVHIHVRLAERPEDVTAIRVGAGQADGVIGGDLVVAGGEKALGTMAKGRTGVVVNRYEIVTGDFTRDTEFSLPGERLKRAIETRVGPENARFFNATRLAEKLLGDAIYANVLMLGAAWQAGLVPLSAAAIRQAVVLNGAGVDGNLQAFDIGRWAVHDPAGVEAAAADPAPEAETLDQMIDRRADFLIGYQNVAWAARFRDRVAAVRRAEHQVDPASNALTEAAARSLFKLMSYKDEYEVARLHAETVESAVAESFDGVKGLEFHLAPPLIAPKGPDGRPRKIRFGGWMLRVFKALRHGKRLRGGWADPFGWTAERRMERALISRYERDLETLIAKLSPANLPLATEIAALPQSIRGFGHVKARNAAAAAERRAALMLRFEGPSATAPTPDPSLRIAAE